jgi:hypothetical protein
MRCSPARTGNSGFCSIHCAFWPLISVSRWSADAKRALTTDQQLADRFEAIELPRWHNDEAFHRLLSSFQAILPLKQRSDLVSPAMRRLLLERTDGVTVRLVRLIETLAVEAIRSGSEQINQNSLLNMMNPPLLSMAEDAGVSV